MKNILVATDFSIGSENAISHARKIAIKFNSKITYFNSLPPTTLDTGISMDYPFTVPTETVSDLYNVSLEAAKARMIKEIKKDEALGILSSMEITPLDINSGIDAFHENNPVDLIICARSNNHNFIDKIIGSTAQHIIHHTNLPLLVIPQDYENNIFEHIGYASQLEFEEINFLKNFMNWSKFSKEKLLIANIIEDYGLDIQPDHIFIKEMANNFPEDKYKLLQQSAYNFETGINEIIQAQNLSLLAVATHKRDVLTQLINPSKVKKIIASCKIPVLVYNFRKDEL